MKAHDLCRARRRTFQRWLLGPAALLLLVSTTAVLGATPPTSAVASASRSYVPPLTSIPLSHPSPSLPQADEHSQKANPTSPRVRQLTHDDTATTDVWQQADGAVQAELNSRPVNYQPPGQATFAPIVTTLVQDPARAGRWQSKANTWTASFGASGTATWLVQITGLSAALGFNPVDAEVVSPTITGSTATYPDLWPDVNAVYRVTTTGVTEGLVLTSDQAQPTFDFDLGPGVTAQSAAPTGGLELLSGGQPLAVVPPLTVTTADGTIVPAATSGATQVAAAGSTRAQGSVIAISVSPAWLASQPPTAFPITIDPSLTTSMKETGGYSLTTSSGHNSHLVEVGSTGIVKYRGVVQFSGLDTLMRQSPPWGVSSATLDILAAGGHLTTSTTTSVYLDQMSGFLTTYAAVSAGTLLGTGTGRTIVSIPLGGGRTSPLTRLLKDSSPGNVFFGLVTTGGGATTSKIYVSPIVGTSNDIQLVIELPQAAPATTTTSPVNGSTIPTTTPTVTAKGVTTCLTYPGVGHHCTTVSYDMQISTDPEGSGSVVQSGWFTPPSGTTPISWTVPQGSLVDGTTYYVRTLTRDVGTNGIVTPRAPGSVNQFKVTLHLGSGGPSPTDTVGAAPGATTTPSAGAPSPGTSPASVTVNLVTGDLAFTSNTHQLTTLSGSVGLSLSYNSMESSEHGLLGQYFRTANGRRDFSATDTLVTRRLDPTVDERSGAEAVTGGIGTGQPFLVKWTGEITVPTAGQWKLGVTTTTGMRVYEGSGATLVVNDWTGTTPSWPTPDFGSTLTLSTGPHAVTVEAWSSGPSLATFGLWAKQVSTGSEYEVPSTWLAPNPLTLPAGWSLSAASLEGGWNKLDDFGSEVVLEQGDGTTASFTNEGHGHYEGAAGYTELLLTVDAAGQFQLSTPTEQLYTFNAAGTVTSVVTVADDRHPAALSYTYSGSNLALTKITDPVSTRSVHLYYGGTSSCPSTDRAPSGLLCLVTYWDGTQTTFVYNGTGELVRVVNPGDEIADFGYTAKGRVDAIRDPLANDAISAGEESDCPATGTTEDCETQIAYTTTGKVSSVTQPAPTPGTARPKRTYTYTATARTASVDIAGFAHTAEAVKYDSQDQIITETTAAGLTTKVSWNDVTEPVATITPKGEEKASVYNLDGEVTDTYGPAPTACFTATSYLPVATPVGASGCGVAVPHAHAGYDQGIDGLAATYWTNATMAGAPSRHGTIGSAAPTWSSSPVGTNDWSARYTGTIYLVAGVWNVFGTSSGSVSAYLDGQWVLSHSGGTGSGVFTVPTTGLYTIEIDYENSTMSASGGFTVYCARQQFTTTTPEIVGPAPTWLDPNYGLKTSTTTPDGDVTDYSYTDAAGGIGPQDGLVTSTTQNPGGLDLTTTTDYENPSTSGTYLRKTATILPDGGATKDLYYSGTGGPIAAVCGVGATTPQGGQLSQMTGPTPGTPTEERIEQFVYTAAGQQAGVRVGNASSTTGMGWQCTHYDDQGRITSQSWPAVGSTPARTVAYSYGVSGNPLVNSVTTSTRTITSTVDLEGRMISYADSWGKTTTVTYDQAGQVTATTGVGGDVADYYNLQGRLTHVTINGLYAGSGYYCSVGACAGSLDGATFPGFITARYSYNKYGEEDEIYYGTTTTGALFAGDTATYSLGGRMLTDFPVPQIPESTFTNPNPTGGTDFTYDAAGRLIQAYVPGEKIDYNYGASTPSEDCAQPTAGKNTDLTSVVTYPSAGGTATTDYCYNGADQLTKTLTSGTATTAGSGTSTSYSFDTRGNQTENRGTTYTWDSSGRLASATTGTTTITYTYDALNRLIQRTKGSTTTRYAYCGFTTSPCAVLNSSNTVKSEMTGTIGGVLVTVAPGSDNPEFSYPNLEGNYIVTNDRYGTQSWLSTYTPYGKVSTEAKAPKNLLAGGLNEDAFGSAGKLTDATLTTPVVFMGARAYLPGAGRFLSVDPIEGGCANAYVYVRGDPLAQHDLDGQSYCGSITAQMALTIADGLMDGSAVVAAVGDVIGDVLGALGAFEAENLKNAAETALTWAQGQRTAGNYRNTRGSTTKKTVVGMVAITVPTLSVFGFTTGIPDGLPTFIPWVKGSYTSKGVNPCTQ